MFQTPIDMVPGSSSEAKQSASNATTKRKTLTLLLAGLVMVGSVLSIVYFVSGPWRRERAYDGAAGQVLDCPVDVDAQVCEAAEFVQVVRGRSFRSFPEVRIMDSDEFEETLTDGWVDERWLEYNDTVYTALGLLGNDVDLIEVERTQGISSILGYYDFTEENITLRGPELNPFTVETLVHELSHAYDHQWLTSSTMPFGPPVWSTETDPQLFVRLVVEEGTAESVAKQWLDAQPDGVKAEYSRIVEEQFGPRSERDEFTVPFEAVDENSVEAWHVHQAYPYVAGPEIVEEITDDNEAIDDLISDPPDTIERLLHPGQSDEVDPVVEVPFPVEVEAEYGGQLGELQLSFVLGTDAAAGWDGDSFVAWDEADRSCITVHIAADSSAELEEMAEAGRVWSEADPNRTAELVERAGLDVLRLATCD